MKSLSINPKTDKKAPRGQSNHKRPEKSATQNQQYVALRAYLFDDSLGREAPQRQPRRELGRESAPEQTVPCHLVLAQAVLLPDVLLDALEPSRLTPLEGEHRPRIPVGRRAEPQLFRRGEHHVGGGRPSVVVVKASGKGPERVGRWDG